MWPLHCKRSTKATLSSSRYCSGKCFYLFLNIKNYQKHFAFVWQDQKDNFFYLCLYFLFCCPSSFIPSIPSFTSTPFPSPRRITFQNFDTVVFYLSKTDCTTISHNIALVYYIDIMLIEPSEQAPEMCMSATEK